MKNIYHDQNKGKLIAALAAGTLVTGALTWLLVSRKGKEITGNWKVALKNKGRDLLAKALTAQTGVSKDITEPAAGAVID